MKPSGWVFLLFAWGFIIGLTVFCFAKVFKAEKTK
jgi:glycerol uptake facilitator-like aquaporin